jgi:prokaryotic ubiquitin-like protein Pup
MTQKSKNPESDKSQQDASPEVVAKVGKLSTEGAENVDQLDIDTDAILADIDEVLEANAEEFVRAYVQKGGQ